MRDGFIGYVHSEQYLFSNMFTRLHLGQFDTDDFFFCISSEIIPLCSKILYFNSSPILVFIYLDPCFEFIDHLTFFFNAYSGSQSESCEIDEWRIQYGFHLLIVTIYNSFSFSILSVISPVSINRNYSPF